MNDPKPTLMAELIAEFLGTFVLILFGIGVVAMVVLFPSNNPGRDDSRRLHQHHSGLGTRRHHGHLHRWKNFWRASESRCDLGFGGLSRIPLAQSSALLHRADRRSFRCRRPRLLELSARVPPGPIRNWNTPPEFSRPFPRSPALPQAGFLDQLIGTGLLRSSDLRDHRRIQRASGRESGARC